MAINKYAGWYIGRIITSGVASVKGGTSPEVQDTVFYWKIPGTKPTVNTVDVTDLTAIVGGPYATEAAAQQAAGKDPNPTSGLPGTPPKPPVAKSTVGSSNGKPLPNPLSGLAAIGAFFNDLSDANTWIRVGKVLTGGALIIVAVVSMTGAGPTIVKTAVKAAPFL